MARGFNGTSQYLTVNSFSLGFPRTYGFWFYPTGASGTAFFIFNTGLNYEITYISTTQAQTSVNAGGANTTMTGSVTPTANAWNHFAMSEASASSRTMYINGQVAATSSVSRNNGSSFTLTLGANNLSSPSQYYTGRLADVFATSIALTADQIQAMATGAPVTPFMATQSVGFVYWPLWGAGGASSNEAGLGTTYVLSQTNSPTVENHAPVGPYVLQPTSGYWAAIASSAPATSAPFTQVVMIG